MEFKKKNTNLDIGRFVNMFYYFGLSKKLHDRKRYDVLIKAKKLLVSIGA